MSTYASVADGLCAELSKTGGVRLKVMCYGEKNWVGRLRAGGVPTVWNMEFRIGLTDKAKFEQWTEQRNKINENMSYASACSKSPQNQAAANAEALGQEPER